MATESEGFVFPGMDGVPWEEGRMRRTEVRPDRCWPCLFPLGASTAHGRYSECTRVAFWLPRLPSPHLAGAIELTYIRLYLFQTRSLLEFLIPGERNIPPMLCPKLNTCLFLPFVGTGGSSAEQADERHGPATTSGKKPGPSTASALAPLPPEAPAPPAVALHLALTTLTASQTALHC